jgi:trans-2,3-dihydro-3-hydroxyanthranilate isomerase
MPVYPLFQVDAFTDHPLGGNPCAVVFGADDLTPDEMQAVAREMNLSETAFVRRSEQADFAVRYFTPFQEIPMAGHPTLATAYALVDGGLFRLSGEHTRLTLELQVGPLLVDLYAQEGKIRRIMMTQKKPLFLDTFDPVEVLPVFGLAPEAVLPGAPVQIVSTGTPQLMIAVRDLESLRQIRLDLQAYTGLHARAAFFSTHLFCTQGVTPVGDTFARHFAPPPNPFEDPFTGSASGGMGAFLWRYGLIERPTFTAEQGHWIGRPGLGIVEAIGERVSIETVRVGGAAVTVLRGELIL